jgi:hypothetical protein
MLDDCVCTDHWELPILVGLSPIQNLLQDPYGIFAGTRFNCSVREDSATSLRKAATEIVKSSYQVIP